MSDLPPPDSPTEVAFLGAGCLDRVRRILSEGRDRAWQGVNAVMLSTYWQIGREVVEEEQRGHARADYGTRLLRHMAEKLTEEFGKGYSERNLRYIRQFYLGYSDRLPPIRDSSSAEVSAPEEDARPLLPALSWTHYRVLLGVTSLAARSFYEVECVKSGWSVRELQRQIASLLFERLARSRDKEGVLALARQGQEVSRPTDLVKDPYVLEFVDLLY